MAGHAGSLGSGSRPEAQRRAPLRLEPRWQGPPPLGKAAQELHPPVERELQPDANRRPVLTREVPSWGRGWGQGRERRRSAPGVLP